MITRALDLARDCGARLSLLNVVTIDDGRTDTDKQRCTAHQEAIKKLSNLGLELAVPKFDQHVRVGEFESTIVEIAKELAIDLIMLGIRKNKPEIEQRQSHSIIDLSKLDTLTAYY